MDGRLRLNAMRPVVMIMIMNMQMMFKRLTNVNSNDRIARQSLICRLYEDRCTAVLKHCKYVNIALYQCH